MSSRAVSEILWEHFQANAERLPDKVAVVSHHVATGQAERLTYREVHEHANRFAAALVELNVQPGDVVSFQLPNWWQAVALHLACVRIGAIANPIITILRRREVAFIVERVEARVFIVPGVFRDFDHGAMAADLMKSVPTLEHVFVVNADGALPEGGESFEDFFVRHPWEDKHPPADLDRLLPAPEDHAEIMFTSGTTGEPKGVLHNHVTMDLGVRSVCDPLELGDDDVILMFSPIGHQTGYLWGICMPMKQGAKVVLQDVWDPHTMLRLIDQEKVTWTMGATTFVLDSCAAKAEHPELDLSSLRFFTCGGAPIPPKAVQMARSVLGTQLVAVWGMTEIAVCTTTLPSDSDERVCSSDGKALSWVQLKIDEDSRLLVKTPSQHLTYFKRQDLYDVQFDADGWFDTGDLATMDADGYIRISGRSKDLIIRGGENIPAAEVEAGIITHPKVFEVAVVAYPDERLSERACAVVVPAGDEAPTLEELKAHLESLGMAKPFWPERLEIRRQLPKTASGKIQKYVLRQQFREG